MIALLVKVNGKRICLAGIGDHGVLGAGIEWINTEHRKRLAFHVGGLADDTFHEWTTPKLKVGDKVLIQVVEADQVEPAQQLRRSKPRHRRAKAKRRR